MKRKTASFTGMRPIFTGSPSIVQGGFNLDVEGQKFRVGDVVPAGTLAIFNETTRKVQVIKTAKVVEVDNENNKKVTLYVDEFYAPCFAVGDSVLKVGAVTGTLASAPTITAIDNGNCLNNTGNVYVVTLSAAITGLKAGDVLTEVVKDSSNNAAERGKANSVLFREYEVSEFETGVDVSADTMQYALYERRVPPIPSSQKDSTGMFLSANPHVKLTQSY
jgi:hypothetical protein